MSSTGRNNNDSNNINNRMINRRRGSRGGRNWQGNGGIQLATVPEDEVLPSGSQGRQPFHTYGDDNAIFNMQMADASIIPALPSRSALDNRAIQGQDRPPQQQWPQRSQRQRQRQERQQRPRQQEQRQQERSSRMRDDPVPRRPVARLAEPVCAHCLKVGHEVQDCIDADANGTVTGCPYCNLPHSWEDCPRRDGSLAMDYEMLVVCRANKPPLRNERLDWFRIWVDAGRVAGYLPWTIPFPRRMAQRQDLPEQYPDWDANTYQYQSVGLPRLQAPNLPRDPATVWRNSPDELRLPSQQYFRRGCSQAGRRSRANRSNWFNRSRSPPADRADSRTRREQEDVEMPDVPAPLSPEIPPDPASVPAPISPEAPPDPASVPVPLSPEIPPDPASVPLANSPDHNLDDGDESSDESVQFNYSDIPELPRRRGRRVRRPRNVISSVYEAAREARELRERPESPPINIDCPNCGHADCRGPETCTNCAACGEVNCHITTCPRSENMCVRVPYPGHLKENCKILCRPCWQAQADKENGSGVIRAIRCPEHCAICAQPRANGKFHGFACTISGCRLCGDTANHMSQDCPTLVCSKWSHINFAGNHELNCSCCATCGHQACPPLPGLADQNHRCQWGRLWEPLTLTGAGKTMSVPVLFCRENASHERVRSEDLNSVRRLGYDRMTRAMEAWVKGGEVGESPMIVRPVIECRQCFELFYDAGDYETQMPGPRSDNRSPVSSTLRASDCIPANTTLGEMPLGAPSKAAADNIGTIAATQPGTPPRQAPERGSKRKRDELLPMNPLDPVEMIEDSSDGLSEPQPKRKMGRPRKNTPVEESSSDVPTSPRRLRPRQAKSPAIEEDEHIAEDSVSSEDEFPSDLEPLKPPAKRGPDRPPKNPGQPKKKSGRPVGRPRKNPEEPKKKRSRTLARELARSELDPTAPGSIQKPSMTKEEAEERLPRRYVGNTPLWTDEDEQQLQDSWTADDQAVLEHHCATNTAESPLWRMMIHLFGRHPYDLFRYGLKYDDSVLGKITVGGRSFTNPGYLSSSICDKLQTMLCHPIWRADLSRARYVLQIAIMHRVPGHIFPIGPLPVSRARSSFAAELLHEGSTERARHFNFVAYQLTYPGSDPEIESLCEIIKKIVERDDETDDLQPREQTLFLLQHKDVSTVIEALDQLHTFGQRTYESCDAHLLAYKQTLECGSKGPFPPRDPATLKRWKRDCALPARRDWIVAVRHWEHNVDARGVEDPIYDIAYVDPPPFHLDCELLEVTDAHRAIVRGTMWPLSKTAPPKRGFE